MIQMEVEMRVRLGNLVRPGCEHVWQGRAVGAAIGRAVVKSRGLRGAGGARLGPAFERGSWRLAGLATEWLRGGGARARG
jgi:hypothetical protein